MAGPNLPTNRTTASTIAEHVSDHNAAHNVVNKFDKDATPTDGQSLIWDATASVYLPRTGGAVVSKAVGNDSADDYGILQAELTALVAGETLLGRKGATYRLSNSLVPPSGVTIDFQGAGLRAGATRAGTLASQDNMINLQNKSDVTIRNGRFLLPASVYSGGGERSVILMRDGARNVVTRCTFTEATGGDIAVRVRGDTTDDCEVSFNTVTGYGIVYSQDGADRTKCLYNYIENAPQNGLHGNGNGTASVTYNDDCQVIGNTVINCGRMGIEDWSQVRGTIITNNLIRNPGQAGVFKIGISAVGSNTLVQGNTIIDPTIGIESGSSGTRVIGNLIEYLTVAADDGITVNAGGINSKWGSIVKGNIIRGARRGIITIGAFSSATISENHIENWTFRGVEHTGTGHVSLMGNMLRQATPNNVGSTRMAINMGAGTPPMMVQGNSVVFVSTAGGGANADIMLQFSSGANQLVIGNTFDAGGVTSPSVPRVDSNSQTGADAKIVANSFIGGATFFVTTLVRPVSLQNIGATVSGTTTHGFYGATNVAKPAITGSRGGNAALADLLTDLATLGLITDSTSA